MKSVIKIDEFFLIILLFLSFVYPAVHTSLMELVIEGSFLVAVVEKGFIYANGALLVWKYHLEITTSSKFGFRLSKDHISELGWLIGRKIGRWSFRGFSKWSIHHRLVNLFDLWKIRIPCINRVNHSREISTCVNARIILQGSVRWVLFAFHFLI